MGCMHAVGAWRLVPWLATLVTSANTQTSVPARSRARRVTDHLAPRSEGQLDFFVDVASCTAFGGWQPPQLLVGEDDLNSFAYLAHPLILYRSGRCARLHWRSLEPKQL